jgi:hypothetical protein
VALAEIAAVNRRFPQLTQVQMQAALRAALQGVTAEQQLHRRTSQEDSPQRSQAELKLQVLPLVMDNKPAGEGEGQTEGTSCK